MADLSYNKTCFSENRGSFTLIDTYDGLEKSAGSRCINEGGNTILTDANIFDQIDNVHSEESPPISSTEVVESFGAGFFVVLPILLVIFGGRLILSMLFK
jgi:hypothetical protein